MKYEFTDEVKIEDGVTLRRIRAVRDFDTVKVGDLGGWLEKELNLSQEGGSWVGDEAIVYGKAQVCGNAWVCNNAKVSGYAVVTGYTHVFDNAMVTDNAMVFDNAMVAGNARVFDNANVGGKAEIYGNAMVKSPSDYAVFKNFWSSFRWMTYTRSNKMWKVGCFYGTGEALVEKAYSDNSVKGRCYEAIVNAVKAIEEAL